MRNDEEEQMDTELFTRNEIDVLTALGAKESNARELLFIYNDLQLAVEAFFNQSKKDDKNEDQEDN